MSAAYTVLVSPTGIAATDTRNLQDAIDFCADATPPVTFQGANPAPRSGAVQGKGGVVLLAEGVFKIDRGLQLKQGVVLQGSGSLEYRSTASANAQAEEDGARGTWIFVTYGDGSFGSGAAAITAWSGTSVRNVGLYYPSQTGALQARSLAYIAGNASQAWMAPVAEPAVSMPAAPISFPPTIELASGAKLVTIEQCYFKNPYVAIDALGGHENLLVIDCFGYPLYCGIRVDAGSDNDRFVRVSWGRQYWPVGRVDRFVRAFGVAFLLAQSDWSNFTECCAFGYRRGFWFAQGIASGPGGVAATDCQARNCGEPIVVTAASGLRLVGCRVAQVDVPAGFGTVDRAPLTGLSGAGIWLTAETGALSGPSAVILDACTVESAAEDGIRVSAGNDALITGCVIQSFGGNVAGNRIAGAPHSGLRLDGSATGSLELAGSTVRGPSGTCAVGMLGGLAGPGAALQVQVRLIGNTLDVDDSQRDAFPSGLPALPPLQFGAQAQPQAFMAMLNQVSRPAPGQGNWYGVPPAGAQSPRNRISNNQFIRP